MKPTRCLYLVTTVLLLTSASCGPYVGTCSWIEPEVGNDIEVLGPRRPVGSECNCLRCSAPGDFELRRENYVLTFWNGDRWYAELLLRARSPEGEPLALESSQLMSLAQAEGLEGRWKEFDYLLQVGPVGQPPPGVYRHELHVTVRDRSGRALGAEIVRLTITTRKDLGIEWI